MAKKFNGTGKEILTVSEMYNADQEAIKRGISSSVLMENAGVSVTNAICERWTKRQTTILCGPGNNGGDGFVIARLLFQKGWSIKVSLAGKRESLKGDAAKNAERWRGEIIPIDDLVLGDTALVVDALFGAGLVREIEGSALKIIKEINKLGLPCVAVDIPSGVNGDTGSVLGAAPNCSLTVTFFRRKPGHLLFPGREICGETISTDIGIPKNVLNKISPVTAENHPKLWLSSFPWAKFSDHKYKRGHALIAGGKTMTGAARLAARSAYRIGAGMVSIAASPVAVPVYANDDPCLVICSICEIPDFIKLLKDERKNAVLIGPGSGVSHETKEMALLSVLEEKYTVLDADALTVFEGDTLTLFSKAKVGLLVLTPHEGEFARLFDFTGDKLTRCRLAAAASNSVVVLKGADTVIASPDGRAVINFNSPATLATAGSGDVLAGLIVGLIAQGLSTFLAASAACWIHGAAAKKFGPGLIASDLPELVPKVLSDLNLLRNS